MNAALFHRQLARSDKTITLQNRAIVAPVSGGIDFDEAFTADTVVAAIIDTRRGSTLFDGVATDRPITHKFCIAYLSGIEAGSTWVLFGGRRFNIIDVENCEEDDVALILSCTETGVATAEASKV